MFVRALALRHSCVPRHKTGTVYEYTSVKRRGSETHQLLSLTLALFRVPY